MNLTSLLKWVKGGLNKWRIAFLIFAAIYATFLIFNLSYMSAQWDEVVHLDGGLFLLRGNIHQFQAWNSFYPPMYDFLTTGFFAVGGASLFMGRFVSVVFSLLSVYAVFEFTHRIYNPKTALLASIMLAVMPGYVWLSRVAMIETTLIFFFTVSTLFFFLWLKEHKNKFFILSAVTFIFGVLTKYQTVIVGIIAIAALAFLGRNYLMQKFRTIPRLILGVVVVAVLLILFLYWYYSAGMMNQWLYAMNIGNPDKTVYSTGLNRFPAWFDPLPSWIQLPIFYLIEIVQPYPSIHPISLVLYAIGLAGLAMLALRRKPEDKYLLIWFVVVYVFFTAIPNRQWRYLVPLFAVLAISGANLVTSALSKGQKTWNTPKLSLKKKRILQFASVLLIISTLGGVAYSVNDAYTWVASDQISIPIQETANYLGNHLAQNQSAVIVCAFNLLDQDLFQFYLPATAPISQVWQYPDMPVDTYPPNFNITEFVNLCEQRNVKYMILYDYGANSPFYNSTLTYSNVLEMIYATNRFGVSADQPNFGTMPHRIFLVRFNQTQT